MTFIKENPDGLTGYQLQENYRFTRGTALRILEKLEQKEYVTYEEVIEDGRGLKKYSLTEQGKRRLTELQEKWGSKFARLGDLAPFSEFGHPFRRPGPMHRFEKNLNRFSSKEDAVDYLRGMRSRVKRQEKDLASRIEHLNGLKADLSDLIDRIEEMPDYSPEQVQKMISEISNRLP